MVTVQLGAPLDWDSADFAWHEADAGKTWLTACPADYTLTPTVCLTLLPTAIRAPHLSPQESARLTSRTARTAARTSRVLLTAQDTLAPRTKSRRTLTETVTAAEADARHTSRTDRSACRLTEAYLTPWQGILSSITLLDSGLPETAWKRVSVSPSGYEAFHPFEVGEYTYREALIRLLLTTGAAGADPLLYDVRFHVDIEDTRESGIADCTADAPTRITLTRHYHHPPRIVLTVLAASGDEVLIPRLTAQGESDGERTFDCELLRTDGIRSDGTLAWMAEGY